MDIRLAETSPSQAARTVQAIIDQNLEGLKLKTELEDLKNTLIFTEGRYTKVLREKEDTICELQAKILKLERAEKAATTKSLERLQAQKASLEKRQTSLLEVIASLQKDMAQLDEKQNGGGSKHNQKEQRSPDSRPHKKRRLSESGNARFALQSFESYQLI